MQPLQTRGQTRLEKPAMPSRTLHLLTPFALAPVQCLSRHPPPARAHGRRGRLVRRTPRADLLKSLEERPRKSDNRQHGKESQLERGIEQLGRSPYEQRETRSAESVERACATMQDGRERDDREHQ